VTPKEAKEPAATYTSSNSVVMAEDARVSSAWTVFRVSLEGAGRGGGGGGDAGVC
jgi:hypothetical protein